jgi:tetratricopeptide (TPR) repeat protein
MQFVLGSKVNNGPDYPRDRTWGADELDRRAAGLNRMAEIQADFNDLFSAMTRLDLAVVPLDRGDLDRGIDMLNELIASKKLSHFQYELYAHDLLAWAYHFKGRDDEAVALLDPWLSGTRPTRDSDMNWISLGAAIFRRDLDALIDASRWMADNPPTNISGWTEDSRRFRIGLACAALARFTIEHGRAEEAARLLGAWLLPDDGNYLRFEVRPIREMVEPRLEPDVFARELAWATGRPADELIAFALETAFGTRST